MGSDEILSNNETEPENKPRGGVADEVDILENFNPRPLVAGITLFLTALELPYRRVEIPKFVMASLGLVGLIVLLFITFESHFLTLLVLTAYLPYSKILAGDFAGFLTGLNLTNILTILILIGWIARSALHRERSYLYSSADVPIFMFSFLAVVSLIRGGLATDGVSTEIIVELKRYLTPIFFFYLFSSNVRTIKQFKTVVMVASFVVVVVAFMGLKESYIDIGGAGSWDSMRLRGICEQANNTGAFFVYYSFMPLAYFLLTPKEERNRITWALLWFFLCCGWTMTRTFSRGAQISFAITLIFILFCYSKKLALKFIAIVLFVFFFFPQYVPESIIGRFTQIKPGEGVVMEGTIDKSAEGRLVHWKGALVMIRHNPLVGIGYGLYQKQAHLYAPAASRFAGVRDVHQGLLLIGAEMGVPALFFFLVIMLQFFLTGRFLYKNADDRFTQAFGLSVMTMAVGVYVANHFGDRLNSLELSSYYWIMGGTAFAARRLVEQGFIKSRELAEPKPLVGDLVAANLRNGNRLPVGRR